MIANDGTVVLAVDVSRMMRQLQQLKPGRPDTFGPCGLKLLLYNSAGVATGSIIVTQAEHDGDEWIHASIARQQYIPLYKELAALKDAVFGPQRFAFQVFPSEARHVNIHAKALHLWGRADGKNPLPDFGREGTI